MSQPLLLKIYGNLFPVTDRLQVDLLSVCREAFPFSEDIVRVERKILLISFEGLYFPVSELIESIESYLLHGHTETKGKIDVLDLEAWTLERYLVEAERIRSKKVSLNNVLDYSGH